MIVDDTNKILALCDILEAEIEGRPFDRTLAMQLAEGLGSEFPGIQNSIQQICHRIAESPMQTSN